VLACDAGDAFEPNDTFERAAVLSGGSFFTCELAETVRGAFGPHGDDWFAFAGGRSLCLVEADARLIDAPEGTAQVCYYVKPNAADVAVSCEAPYVDAPEPPAGYRGCCGAGRSRLVYGNVSADVLIQVRPTGAASACVDYTLQYQFLYVDRSTRRPLGRRPTGRRRRESRGAPPGLPPRRGG
jgi:hypothetical protein